MKTDQELVDMTKEHSEEAEGLLINKYKYIIVKYVNKYENLFSSLGLERSDIYQEGLIGLHTAIKNYREEKEAGFFTYATICIESSIKQALRSASRQKQKNLNDAISLDYLFEDDKTSLYNLLEDTNSDPSKKVLNSEIEKDTLKDLENNLTSFESQVLHLKLSGLSNEEISKMLGKDKRSIENAIFRIKSKYKEM